MLLPEAVQIRVSSMLTAILEKPVRYLSATAMGGGSINEACSISTSAGNYFLKYNFKARYPRMFAREAQGLETLRGSGTLAIPGVLGHAEAGQYAFLLLELIIPGSKSPHFWDDFAQGLAALHRHTADHFGLDHDNYMGSLSQRNRFHSDWYRFFVEERLEPQIKSGLDSGAIPPEMVRHFERLYTALPGIVPPEPPSLIHGDLWSGNFIINQSGKACLIDPAVSFGHRESDIAMTKLFGGFPSEFYAAYNHSFPLTRGWENRIDLLNLYPLLIHVNLFGGGYLGQVMRTLARF
jgi:protein-ribulosamine 3-kinase